MVNRIDTKILPTIPGRGTPAIQLQFITCDRGATGLLMLEDTLGTVLASGADSMTATCDRLTQRYAGRFAYDFGQRSARVPGSILEGGGHDRFGIGVRR